MLASRTVSRAAAGIHLLLDPAARVPRAGGGRSAEPGEVNWLTAPDRRDARHIAWPERVGAPV